MRQIKKIVLSSTLLLIAISSFSLAVTAQEFDYEMMREFQKSQQERMQRQMQMSQLMQILGNEDMRKELAIVPDQVEELREIVQEYQQLQMKFQMENRESQAKVQQLFREKRMEEAVAVAKEMHAEYDKQSKSLVGGVDEFLLPHQLDRLKQIAKQQSLKYRTRFRDEFGIPLALADELELSQEERKKLAETTEKARAEFYKKVEELKKQTNEKILNSLPATKRAKVKEIIGDYYDHEKQQRREAADRHKAQQERAREQQRRMREQEKN